PEEDAPPLGSLVSDIDPRFAAIVDRCLQRDPKDRFESGDALWNALDELSWDDDEGIGAGGNPYRGLQAFDAEHRALFFGRERESREIVERLRSQSVVLVIGESGIGKSSLIRAGVAPRLVDGALDDGRVWESCTLTPGRHPLHSLLTSLSRWLSNTTWSAGDGRDQARDPPGLETLDLIQRLRRNLGGSRGLVIVVDQLEELVTLSDPDEAARAGELMARIAERTPGVRLLATARDDKMSGLLGVSGLADLLERALYLLRPLGRDAVREIIVRPARVMGVEFESKELVAELVDATVDAPGGLPLLQFALAQLWDGRDQEQAMITRSSLTAIGGVAGALTRHANGVLREMLPPTRQAARRILLRLVSLSGTRLNQRQRELAGDDGARRAALQALVDGRLVVESEVDGEPSYEIAHEALSRGWMTLRRWLDREGGLRAIRERLAEAASHWERQGRRGDVLWRGAVLDEAAGLDMEVLEPLDADFLIASRRGAARARWLRRGLLLAPLVVAGLVYGTLELLDWLDINRAVTDEVRPLLVRAEAEDEARRADCDAAADHFRVGDDPLGEQRYAECLRRADEVAALYSQVTNMLEGINARAPGRVDVHELLAGSLAALAELADELGQDGERDRLRQRQSNYGELAPVLVRTAVVTTSPAGRRVQLQRYELQADGVLQAVDMKEEQVTPARWSLRPGSYRLAFAATEDTVAVYHPFVVVASRAARPPLQIDLALPRRDRMAERLRANFVYVPPGEFVYGLGRNAADEPRRDIYKAVPEHRRTTDGFWIARNETTYAEWIEFLDDLPADKVDTLRAGHAVESLPIRLLFVDGEYHLAMKINQGREYRFRRGETFRYEGRDDNREHEWTQFPVMGIAPEHAERYVQWLARSGRVPGARLCSEDEWEYAARGADGRPFPHGYEMAVTDANFDLRYGQKDSAFGPDTVGMYERSRSPFGLYDMAGNAGEITRSIHTQSSDKQGYALRGGIFYHPASYGQSPVRELAPGTQRLEYDGLRVCADPPESAYRSARE
ncbi:MAG: SUMF1/EgtB/PvdO family nonheme iron enzyme, partial [Myxococcota bacterium]